MAIKLTNIAKMLQPKAMADPNANPDPEITKSDWNNNRSDMDVPVTATIAKVIKATKMLFL